MGPMDWHSSREFKSSCILNWNPFLLNRAKQGDPTGKRQGTSVFGVSQRSQRKFILELLAFSGLSRASTVALVVWALCCQGWVLVTKWVTVARNHPTCHKRGAHFRVCSHVKAMQLVNSQRAQALPFMCQVTLGVLPHL